MHWHILRNRVVPSWAWTADTRRAAQSIARAYGSSGSRNGRLGDTFSLMRCAETHCPDFQEFEASGARDRVERSA